MRLLPVFRERIVKDFGHFSRRVVQLITAVFGPRSDLPRQRNFQRDCSFARTLLRLKMSDLLRGLERGLQQQGLKLMIK